MKLGANTLTVPRPGHSRDAGRVRRYRAASHIRYRYTETQCDDRQLRRSDDDRFGGVLALDSATDISKSSGVIDNGTFPSAPMAIPRSRLLTGTGGVVALGANTLTLTAAAGTYSGNFGCSQRHRRHHGLRWNTDLQRGDRRLFRSDDGLLGKKEADLIVTGATEPALSGVVADGTFDISGNGNTVIASLTGRRPSETRRQQAGGDNGYAGHFPALWARRATPADLRSAAAPDAQCGDRQVYRSYSYWARRQPRLTSATNIALSSGVADAGTFSISGNGNTSITSLAGASRQVNLGANTLILTAAAETFATGISGCCGECRRLHGVRWDRDPGAGDWKLRGRNDD